MFNLTAKDHNIICINISCHKKIGDLYYTTTG